MDQSLGFEDNGLGAHFAHVSQSQRQGTARLSNVQGAEVWRVHLGHDGLGFRIQGFSVSSLRFRILGLGVRV
jgi:hypothetical protein